MLLPRTVCVGVNRVREQSDSLKCWHPHRVHQVGLVRLQDGTEIVKMSETRVNRKINVLNSYLFKWY